MIMAYGDFRGLPWKTASDKELCDKGFDIAKNPKYGYQKRLPVIIYKCFDKKFATCVVK